MQRKERRLFFAPLRMNLEANLGEPQGALGVWRRRKPWISLRGHQPILGFWVPIAIQLTCVSFVEVGY